ncbi:phosphotransferase system enzyme I (PtsP) [Sinobacterium caligoides]|uniref:phosphoenolpyruvate--protein phosphotransferase n=1 Tax=Sinobacterium caligoides TaxID=933926 RepID=A0A3N2DGS3_9GAMM|nr:phosphoenolpyruvate--protein phosphotransferase [Sinobacterium caligoides]ROR98848.1 phosphotransferase system enzyme I (PtsP) [Sinobacterium caligoides]
MKQSSGKERGDRLSQLRRIVQEVNSARDLHSVLDIIVEQVRDALKTEVCSIYLLNPDNNRHQLMATKGLNRDCLGKVSLGIGEGLVGRVALREEAVNIEDAESHPSFQPVPGLGEEQYSSFLGVPVIHHRKVLGVLVVQQQECRRFDEADEAFLVTMSAQLSGVIAHAEATGAIDGVDSAMRSTTFKGSSGALGVAIGRAVVLSKQLDLKSIPRRATEDVKGEVRAFGKALAMVRRDIKQMKRNVQNQLRTEELALFDVYLSMLDDHALGGEVIEKIRQGQWAQWALAKTIREHARTFDLMDDPYLRERAVDIKDLGRRVLSYLRTVDVPSQRYPSNTILVGEELTASMLAEVPEDKLLGLVSVQGSSNSHVAIMARALGIPIVMGVFDLPHTQLDGCELVIDGYSGLVLANPSEQIRRDYELVVEEEELVTRGLEVLKNVPCETICGHRTPLLVNTGLETEIHRALEHGAEGIGLYRTEVSFLLHDRFPSEREQVDIYRRQLEAFKGRPVTMRTLDIGGDKALPYFPIEEENPFLGWRGIRVTLDHPEIFLAQVRAMMKASVGLNNMRILLPMISSVGELDESLLLIRRAHRELSDEGVECRMPPIGVMIEVPAAVYQVDALAKRVDFLSVGSNDLTQYLLAVDRNNARVSSVYNAYHPAVLQALAIVAKAANKAGKPVSICGEMAGDPAAAVLLIAMGYNVLSMSSSNLLRVKSVLRSMRLDQAQQLLAEVQQMETSQETEACLDRALQLMGVSRLLRPNTDAKQDVL